MKRYKTITEIKENLPEIFDRINTCKIYFDCDTLMLKGMQESCALELIYPEYSGGWWTTLKAYAETLRNQMEYMAEIEYLTSLLKKLPQYKDKNI